MANAIGRRILYLRTLDIDREQLWALLRPFLDAPPSSAETEAWYERGQLPANIADEEKKAHEEQVLKEQQEPRWMRAAGR